MAFCRAGLCARVGFRNFRLLSGSSVFQEAPRSTSLSLSLGTKFWVPTSHRNLSLAPSSQNWEWKSRLETAGPLFALSRRFAFSVEITVPSLGDSITEGTVEKWDKKVGDSVAMDEVIGSIESDKVSQEIRAPQAGKIKELCVEVGTSVRVGDVIVRLSPGDGLSSPSPSPSPSSPSPSSPPPSPSPSPSPSDNGGEHARTPRIRFKYGANKNSSPPTPPLSTPPPSSPSPSPSPSPSSSYANGVQIFRYGSLDQLPARYHPRVLSDAEILAIETGMEIDEPAPAPKKPKKK